MAHQHLKSACCRARVIHYGGKRRQCVSCKRTWTVRPKRRGRKGFRASRAFAPRYFSGDIPTLRVLERRLGCGRGRMQRVMRKSLIAYITKHENKWNGTLPRHGKLVAIADAIWYFVDGKKLTIYLIFLRPTDTNEATILPPVFVSGHEDGEGWTKAWAQVPRRYMSRINALVCDGQWWLVAFGRRRHWVVQRCHFHLLANLQMYLGVRAKERNQKILLLVRGLLATANTAESSRFLLRLARMRNVIRSRGIRRVLSGFETNYRDFQNYIRFPLLNLPTTTNTAESCASSVRALLHRTRGFRGETALRLWITGYILWKKTILCNGKYQQK